MWLARCSACLLALIVVASASADPRSRALGVPSAGALVNGVRLPAAGEHFFTWDPVLRRSPDRPWRRYGTQQLVRVLLRVIDAYATAHARAPRVGIGDLSRPHGGDFGVRYGWPGHASHQNGLDADVYYPRRDSRERPPDSPSQIDHKLAQDLVSRFVRAGAARIFVGPNTNLRGPSRVVRVLEHHDNHLHVRIAAPPLTEAPPGARREVDDLGTSRRDRSTSKRQRGWNGQAAGRAARGSSP